MEESNALRAVIEAQAMAIGNRSEAIQRDVEARPTSIFDKSGVGKPQPFDGNETEWSKWSFRVEGWVGSQYDQGKPLLKWAREKADVTITDEDVTELARTSAVSATKLS